MRRTQYRTIDSYLSHVRLGGWKTPRPQRPLSWKEIKDLYQKAATLAQVADTGQSGEMLLPGSEYSRAVEEVMVACLSWTKRGEKPTAVRIHDWLEDNIGIQLLQKPFALRQELWYRAIGWEFRNWRFRMSRRYFDARDKDLWKVCEMLDEEIDKETELEAQAKESRVEPIELGLLSLKIDNMMKQKERTWRKIFESDKREDAWRDNYYKQHALLHRWVKWRGLRLSVRDMDSRLCRYA